MHELSLCRAVSGAVTGPAAGRRVVSVRLRIGHFRQVIPETLAFCWQLHTEGTALASSVLDIEHVPAVIRCGRCGHDSTLSAPVLVCAECASTDVELLAGEEFLIESIELAEEAP